MENGSPVHASVTREPSMRDIDKKLTLFKENIVVGIGSFLVVGQRKEQRGRQQNRVEAKGDKRKRINEPT